MRLLIDTDIFCKLSVGGVLQDSLALLGVDVADCGRLPALPYMLKRGGMRTRFGGQVCDALVESAEAISVAPTPSDLWLDKMARVTDIDPGEAQILGRAAEAGILVMTGDKRALRAVGSIDGLGEALSSRVITLEGILIALCDKFGAEVIRARTQPLIKLDTVVEVCFSPGNADPCRALFSYYRDLAEKVAPLILWDPCAGDKA